MSRRGLVLAFGFVSAAAAGAQGLQVRFGPAGLQQLSVNGIVLADIARWPEDRLHIWHMRCVDLATGRPRTEGEYGWGENNRGRVWDANSRTWTYTFVWGSLRVQYLPAADRLGVLVTEQNRAGSGVILDGASIYPLTLHPPAGDSPPALENGREEPVDALLSWPGGGLAVTSADAIYAGFEPGKDSSYAVVGSSTAPDALPEAAELPGLPVRPGDTRSFHFELSTAPPQSVFRSWAGKHQPTLSWADRRILGTVYLASSGQGDKTRPAGFPTNPRRYFNDPAVDITTPAGLRSFQARVLNKAAEVVMNLRRLDAQGAITWDIEGEQYPQSTSYVCAPDQIAQVAPEMESVVAAGLPQAGMKLDDAYFRTLRDAGFRVGVCVRPQRFELGADGTASQRFLPVGEVAAELIRKMRYAHDRWGATLFYLDSTVREIGFPLPSEVLETAAHALPDSLLIPEQTLPRAYGSTAPFRTFLFHGDTGVPAPVRLVYPQAFAANLINDVDPEKLHAHRAELVESVRRGDILMVHAGYWHPNNTTVLEIYREADRHR